MTGVESPISFTAVLQLVLVGLVALVSYLLNRRLLAIEKSQEKSEEHEKGVSAHLATLNGRVAVVETEIREGDRRAAFIEEQHKETRRQCQANNQRQFNELRGIFGRRSTDRAEGETG